MSEENTDWDTTGSWAPLSPPSLIDDDPFDPLPPSRPQQRVEQRAASAAVTDDTASTSGTGDGAAGSEAPQRNRRGRRGQRNSGGHPYRRAGDYEDFPPPRRGRAFLGFLLTLAVIAGGSLAGLRWYKNQVDPPGAPGASIEVTIPTNTSAANIAKLLNSSGVVGNPTVFRYWTQLQGKGGFEAGKYTFHKNSSFKLALDVLQGGPSVPDQNKVTFPEGFRIEQIAARVAEKLPGRTAEKFISAVTSGQIRSSLQPPDVSSLEGFLFPDTYTFGLTDDEASVASRMVDNFDQVADQLGLADSLNKVGVTPYQALIVASLVEREAKLDVDRPKIARVIYNRLKTDTALQIDAAIIYALNNNTTRLLLDDLKLDSPYNTYIHKGLPPGPISNPGRESIQAALNPEVGDWLYYVVTGANGESSFAVTYKEHRKNIALAKERGLR